MTVQIKANNFGIFPFSLSLSHFISISALPMINTSFVIKPLNFDCYPISWISASIFRRQWLRYNWHINRTSVCSRHFQLPNGRNHRQFPDKNNFHSIRWKIFATKMWARDVDGATTWLTIRLSSANRAATISLPFEKFLTMHRGNIYDIKIINGPLRRMNGTHEVSKKGKKKKHAKADGNNGRQLSTVCDIARIAYN